MPGRIEQMIRHVYWEAGAEGFVIGVSGGVDSAVAAALCVRAVGPDRVLALSLPSAVSAIEEIEDARELCRLLGCEHRTISIEPVLDGFRAMPGYVETPYLLGNLMARARMAVLYYHANRERRLVCGTSNRSEYLLGYSTKWGDSAADLQPLLHLFKHEVYRLGSELGVPQRILQRPPSAGLWVGQRDEDELGLSYEEIDRALASLAENEWKARDEVEERVLSRVRSSTHKRVGAFTLPSEG
ncbi:MAG TPA: NAD+ synthase [Methanoregulaceae archaeon]|nr:NAD+ synthase [Methanoregulaceae archaeon]HOV67904.1 NAD+ synthase [Methanoregulaceae archaeon]HQJ87006.1 NAD+ synthase [Methanoregulaceae archaeon]